MPSSDRSILLCVFDDPVGTSSTCTEAHRSCALVDTNLPDPNYTRALFIHLCDEADRILEADYRWRDSGRDLTDAQADLDAEAEAEQDPDSASASGSADRTAAALQAFTTAISEMPDMEGTKIVILPQALYAAFVEGNPGLRDGSRAHVVRMSDGSYRSFGLGGVERMHATGAGTSASG